VSNEITIIVKAKNMLAAGLKSATSDMHVLGKTADKVAGQMINGFKMVAGAVIAAGAAILSAGTVAVKAYAESEAAERNLASAIAGHGGAVDALLPKYKALADEISRKTGMDDEQILGLETLLTNMGVTTAEMEKATKGAIGLSKALGMDQTAAAKAAALALDGNYTALAKYIPALKTATTDSEKAAIVQQAMASGYAAEEAALTTLGGRYRELTTTTGNFLESIGQVISENAMVQDGMAFLSEKIREAQADFEAFAASGKLNLLIMEVELFASHFSTSMKNIWAYAEATFNAIYDIGSVPFTYIGGVIGAFVNAAVTQFEYLLSTWQAVTDFIKHPIEIGFVMPSGAELQAANEQTLKALTKNPYTGDVGKGFADAGASVDANNAADARRSAEIQADFDKAEQERLAKDLAKTETTLGAAAAGDIADVEEEATAANIETATAAKVDKVDTVAAVEAAADTARIDTNTARELESVDLIAKAREEAYAQTDPYDAAKAFAGAGQAITPESIAKNGLIATEQAAQAEADRIQAIVEALNEANGGAEMLKYAEETAANTRAIAELLPQAIAIGA
jgi:hypothetical protein